MFRHVFLEVSRLPQTRRRLGGLDLVCLILVQPRDELKGRGGGHLANNDGGFDSRGQFLNWSIDVNAGPVLLSRSLGNVGDGFNGALFFFWRLAVLPHATPDDAQKRIRV